MQFKRDVLEATVETDIVKERKHEVGIIRFLLLLAIVFLVDVAAHHAVLDRVHVGVVMVHDIHHFAVLHHVDAVGKFEHLLHPVRDEDE